MEFIMVQFQILMKGLFGIELFLYISVIVKYNYFLDDRESSVQ